MGANGTLYFEKWGFSARGSVRHRSSFIGEVSGFGANRTLRVRKAETIVDGQVGYEFQPGTLLSGLSIYLQGQNLTNEPFVTEDGSGQSAADHRLSAVRPPLDARRDVQVRRRRTASAAAAAASAATATAATGDADLRGRIGDPGDRGLPGSAAAASAAAAGAGTRLILSGPAALRRRRSTAG